MYLLSRLEWLQERPGSKSQQLQCKERLQQEVCAFSASSVRVGKIIAPVFLQERSCSSFPQVSWQSSTSCPCLLQDARRALRWIPGPVRDQLNSFHHVTSVTSASAQSCTPVRPFLFRTSSVTSTSAKSCAPLLRCRVITMLVSRLKALSRCSVIELIQLDCQSTPYTLISVCLATALQGRKQDIARRLHCAVCDAAIA